MLLEKLQDGDKSRSLYESSNILASTYDPKKLKLEVIFKNGGVYSYDGVTEADFTRFDIADSQGVVFNSHIKKYPFEKLQPVEPEKFLKEITKIKHNRETDILNSYIEKIHWVLSTHKDAPSVKLMSDISEATAHYTTILNQK